MQDQLHAVSSRVEELAGQRQEIEDELRSMEDRIRQRLASLTTAEKVREANLTHVQDEVQAQRLECRKKRTELEAAMVDQGTAARQQQRTDLNRLETRLRAEMGIQEAAMHTWVKKVVAQELAPLQMFLDLRGMI